MHWPRAGRWRLQRPDFAGVFDKSSQDSCQSPHLQLLEERDTGSGDATMQYTWSPVYVDAMIERVRDSDANGSLDERLWVQQDANWNVTSVANGIGVVVERYVYDAYGVRTVLDANWAADGGGESDVEFDQGYQGMMEDEATGNLKSRNRDDYLPTLGRWGQVDPISILSEDVNFYRFVGNDPANGLDPSGLADVTNHPFWKDYRKLDKAPEGSPPGAGAGTQMRLKLSATTVMHESEVPIGRLGTVYIATASPDMDDTKFEVFLLKSSWVRKDCMGSEMLLRHEKLHQTLSVYVSKIAKKNVGSKFFKATSFVSQKTASDEVKHAFQKFIEVDYYNQWKKIDSAVQSVYETETANMLNDKNQKDWEQNWKKKADVIINKYGWKTEF